MPISVGPFSPSSSLEQNLWPFSLTDTLQGVAGATCFTTRDILSGIENPTLVIKGPSELYSCCWQLGIWLLSCEPEFKAQRWVLSDISTLLFDWYLWELSDVCISYTENAKFTSFCFVWQSHIKPSASHLPCLSGPSTAEPGKNWCLGFSEVSSQFPALSSC